MSVICMDVGGTKLSVGLMDAEGHVFYTNRFNTDKHNVMEQIERSITELLASSPDEITAIGISSAGRVDFATGSINYATENLPGYSGTQVKQIIEQKFKIATIVDNDGNCAAIAEGKLGAGKGFDHFMCITLGTGVGAGIVAEGQLVRGAFGAAGEIGHMLYEPKGRACNCGRSGCWEQYVSGTAIRNEIANNLLLAEQHVTPEQIFYMVDTDGKANEIIHDYIEALSLGLNSLQNIVDPACIVLGGGIIHSSDVWWDKLTFAYKREGRQAELRKAELGNDAGMIGAGLLANSLNRI